MAKVFLLLGGNLGDRSNYLDDAAKSIGEEVGVVENASALYESPPWGFESGDKFYNRVLSLKTDLEPFVLLTKLKKIEKQLGRVAKGSRGESNYTSRVIDIDILSYDDRVIDDPLLKIPHPRMHLRKFTLLPLAEIAPSWRHPVKALAVTELIQQCEDQSEVVKVEQS